MRGNGMQRFTSKNDDYGFTLIELMIVVAIIGVLASIAIPRFQNNAMASRQVEAEEVLSAVYTGQAIYFGENSTYGNSEAQINVDMVGNRVYSTTVFTGVSASGYTATVTANLDNDATLDRWVITEASSEPTQTCNDITNVGPAC